VGEFGWDVIAATAIVYAVIVPLTLIWERQKSPQRSMARKFTRQD
jgi:hypothetical protein